jgi:hypothetical protein
MEAINMGLSVKDIAGALKLENSVVERLAKYLYPNKVLLTHDEALVLRDYYYKFGGGPAGVEIGPYNEWMKLERMKALIRARLEVIEEKQSAAVGKLSALSGVYPLTNETLPAKMAPGGGYNPGGLLKFPMVKPTTARNAPKKERSGLFAGLR